mgnify:CR=1 FL=1
MNDKVPLIIEVAQGSSVKIEIQNKTLEGQKKSLFMILYWVLALLGGYGEYLPFGLPFNALLRIENVDKEDIYVQTNSYKMKNAFSIKTKCNIVENRFVSPKGYKRTWFLGYVMPVSLLVLGILFILILLNVQEKYIVVKGFFVAIAIICSMGWIRYVYSVLKR